jgi:2-dehydro-3-deoxyphosphogluconate aldolase/(4S)-4-hydroxy-2-oxoglutarate aldolase
MRRQDVVGAIEDVGVVAVIRLKEPDKLHSVIDALAEGGVRALEVTMTVPRAIELIAELAPRLPPGFQIGAGTVIDAETARLAIMAGATFVVGPVLKPDVITTCHRYDVAVMPGCFTPTEILTAWEHGADVVKVFPATSLGPGFFKDLRGPLPQIKMMPTGGVTIENAGAWIKAGAIAVGAGTALLDTKAIEAGDFRVIAERARLIVARVSAARKG